MARVLPLQAAPSRRTTLAACGIVAAGGALRIWTIGAGAPYRWAADEPVVVGAAVHMMKTGDFSPPLYDYGGLTFYLHVLTACVRFLTGAMSGEWSSLDGVWEGDFLVASRLLSAAFGTLTVLLVYRIGLRWGPQVALAAAGAMAVLSQHVRESHYALTDTPLTFFVALACLLSLRASERGRTTTFLAAGMAAGAAAAVKYNGGLAIAMPLMALFGPAVGSAGMAAGAVVGGAALGFFGGAPYTLLDLPRFLDGFAVLMQAYNRPTSMLDAATTYLAHMRNWFSWSGVINLWFGCVALGLCAVGLAVGLWQIASARTRAAALVLVVFPLWYFWLIASGGSLVYGRYALPITPALCVLLGLGFAAVRERLLRTATLRRRVGAAALLLVFMPPLGASIDWNLINGKQATSEMAGAWLLQHAAPGDRIVIEAVAVRLPPKVKTELVLRLIDRSVDQYRSEGATYLVTSSIETGRYDPVRRPRDLAAYRALLSSTEIVQSFTGGTDHPGPTIAVLKVPRP